MKRNTAEESSSRLGSELLLAAIDEHGPRWPAVLGPQFDQMVLNAAMDREVLAGTVLDAVTLSPRGRAVLQQAQAAP